MLKCVLIGLMTLTSMFASRHVLALTGDELLKQCAAPDDSVEKKQCGSYILGALAGANMMMIGMKQLHPDSTIYPVLFCVTSVVPTAQLVDVVLKYLKLNPDGLKYDAASEVLLSFREAFPCR